MLNSKTVTIILLTIIFLSLYRIHIYCSNEEIDVEQRQEALEMAEENSRVMDMYTEFTKDGVLSYYEYKQLVRAYNEKGNK